MEVAVTVFLTRRQLGERWHVAPGTLANWATQGEGPESRVIAGRILYRLSDVEAWEAEQWAGKRPARDSRGRHEHHRFPAARGDGSGNRRA